MPTLVCPACGRANGALALRCEACRAVLHDDDTVPGVLLRSEPPPAASVAEAARPANLGALWLHDLVDAPPADAAVTVPGGLAPPVSPTATQPPRKRLPRTDVVPPPTVPMTLRIDVDVDIGLPGPSPSPAPGRQDAPPRTAVQKLLAAGRATRSAAKAAHRAAVRKARLGNSPAAAEGAVREVLVLEAEDRARAELHALLRAFGFNVSTTVDPRVAAALVSRRRFAACFVDVALDGSDGGAGVEFCRALRRADQAEGQTRTLLVLVAPRRDVTGEVRARLAGCDAVIPKPVSRGDVARAFEGAGVALPADERRS